MPHILKSFTILSEKFIRMTNKGRIFQWIGEQIAIDALLDNLNRDLFYLLPQTRYDEYMNRLTGKKIKKKKSRYDG
ncbi:MAG: hypothetical protein WDO16_24415 [Bacteroidota bacterium]